MLDILYSMLTTLTLDSDRVCEPTNVRLTTQYIFLFKNKHLTLAENTVRIHAILTW